MGWASEATSSASSTEGSGAAAAQVPAPPSRPPLAVQGGTESGALSDRADEPAAAAALEAPATAASAAAPEAESATLTPISPSRRRYDSEALLPASRSPEESAIERSSKPFLASEALMEDLAPVEPARRSAKRWCAGLGIGLIFFGVLPLVHLRSGGAGAAIPSLVVGFIALVAALSPVTYRQRAVAMVVLGLLSGIVGLDGTAVGGTRLSLMRLAPAIALSAALVFRSRYRAYSGARIFLGIALALSCPFVILTALNLSDGFGAAQAGSIVALIAIAASLTGFMGAETTGAPPYLAHGIVIAFAIELALRALFAPDGERTSATIPEVVSVALAFAGASRLAALGLFQILAWRFAADARRINLHSARPVDEDKRDSDVDWATRG